nr:hypothetical protein CFP56_30213 [Quercus suber]
MLIVPSINRSSINCYQIDQEAKAIHLVDRLHVSPARYSTGHTICFDALPAYSLEVATIWIVVYSCT